VSGLFGLLQKLGVQGRLLFAAGRLHELALVTYLASLSLVAQGTSLTLVESEVLH
jgi:hypothetical protein